MLGKSQSGVPIDSPWIHVFDFTEGQIVRTRNFTALDVARQAIEPLRLVRAWSQGG